MPRRRSNSQAAQEPAPDEAQDATLESDAEILQRSNLSPTDLIGKVVEAILGEEEDLEQYAPRIKQLAANQEVKAQLLASLTQANDQARLARLLKVRDKLEHKVVEAANEDDISTADAAAMYEYLDGKTKTLQDDLHISATGMRDVTASLSKLDVSTQKRRKELEDKLRQTTPQGREIVRRIAHGLAKTARSADQPQSRRVPD